MWDASGIEFTTNINNIAPKIKEASSNPEEYAIEDLTEIKNANSECERSLDQLTTEIYLIPLALSPDQQDSDSLNGLLAKYFDRINSNQEEIASLIKQQRRVKEQDIKRFEIERNNFEQQKSQQPHEMNMLLTKIKRQN